MLRVFYGMGNPFVKSFRHYPASPCRRLTIFAILDDRPVFEDERSRCEAWFAALAKMKIWTRANAAERDMIKQIKQEKRDQEERRVKAFDDMIREARAAHAAAEAAKQLEGVRSRATPSGVNGPLRDENADPNKPRSGRRRRGPGLILVCVLAARRGDGVLAASSRARRGRTCAVEQTARKVGRQAACGGLRGVRRVGSRRRGHIINRRRLRRLVEWGPRLPERQRAPSLRHAPPPPVPACPVLRARATRTWPPRPAAARPPAAPAAWREPRVGRRLEDAKVAELRVRPPGADGHGPL